MPDGGKAILGRPVGHDDMVGRPRRGAGRAVVDDPPDAPTNLTLYAADEALPEIQIGLVEAVRWRATCF